MIKLNLLEACHDCTEFEPIKTKCHTLMYGDEVVSTSCEIICKHLGKCRALLEHLEKEAEKDGK